MQESQAAAIADVIPRFLPAFPGKASNPWGVSPRVLQEYNQANGASYTDADLTPQGRAIAVWHLRRIDDELARAGSRRGVSPPARDVILGYLVGWAEIAKGYRGQQYVTPSMVAMRRAAAIAKAAGSGDAAPQALPDPTLEPIPKAPKRRSYGPKLATFGSGWQSALWVAGSIATLPLLAKWLNRKR